MLLVGFELGGGDFGEGVLGLLGLAQLELASGGADDGWGVGWVGGQGLHVEVEGRLKVLLGELQLGVLEELVDAEDTPEHSEQRHN